MIRALDPATSVISSEKVIAAAKLWRDGKDTRQIAQALRIPEAVIANQSQRIRFMAKNLQLVSE